MGSFDVMELIGWVGGICFAICAMPQALHSIKHKNSHGLTWAFLLLWLIGEIFSFIYVIPKGHLPLIFNYTVNLVFLIIIMYYKIYPKSSS